MKLERAYNACEVLPKVAYSFLKRWCNECLGFGIWGLELSQGLWVSR